LTKIFDSHTHLFSPAVIANVSRRKGLAEALHLEIDKAAKRTGKAALKHELQAAEIHGSLLLPTAPMDAVRKVNDLFLETIRGEESLLTAGTLHPFYPDIDGEIERLSNHNVRALKFSSFSQGIDLEAEETFSLFDKICSHNQSHKAQFFAILDTFYRADFYFGVPGKHVTTPEKLARLVTSFPGINFVGAHMGGLMAPFGEIEKYLIPHKNLYLETSNAAHVLPREEFLHLLNYHGPERILFGTDWPWFGHKEEAALIRGLLQEAGFSLQEQSEVFGGNIFRLLKE
jgi:predicted TIM-barrel fold metal-dependent hydrolase